MASLKGAVSERIRLRRVHQRGKYDSKSIYEILDAMPVCSIGYTFDDFPFVTSTLQWREGNHVYWHGSSASRMLRAVDSAKVCLNVSILDGFVMARSGFHHSVNYRSVMMFGNAHKIAEPDEKEARLKAFVDALFPGRWDSLRPVTAQEIKATTVLSMPIDEAAAKVRTGQPSDDEEDYSLPIWSGVLPVKTVIGEPVPDPRNLEGLSLPDHIANFKLGLE